MSPRHTSKHINFMLRLGTLGKRPTRLPHSHEDYMLFPTMRDYLMKNWVPIHETAFTSRPLLLLEALRRHSTWRMEALNREDPSWSRSLFEGLERDRVQGYNGNQHQGNVQHLQTLFSDLSWVGAEYIEQWQEKVEILISLTSNLVWRTSNCIYAEFMRWWVSVFRKT